jgi:hypothetical protein
MGGLDYPSNRSDKRIWRKWVPKTLKKVVSALAAPNEGLKPIVARGLLESTGWVSKYNTLTRQDLLENLLKDVPLPRNSRPHLDPSMLDGGALEVGMVTWDDLREIAGLHTKYSKNLRDDAVGNHYSSPEWRGKRRFRRQIERETPFRPLSDLINQLQRDDCLRAVLQGIDRTVPYFTYGDHVKTRLQNRKKAVTTVGREQVAGTPIVRFTSFFDLKTRLDEVSQTVWVNTDHAEIRDLLSLVGNLRVDG